MPIAPSPYIVDEYVRWSDVDKAGIIFYGAYVRFFEIAGENAGSKLAKAEKLGVEVIDLDGLTNLLHR